jgi:hypothetical protein
MFTIQEKSQALPLWNPFPENMENLLSIPIYAGFFQSF